MHPHETPSLPLTTPEPLRVVTYNIHKGVQGMGPAKRLEIHNLQRAIDALGADVVCLQEVRKMNRKGELRFVDWPRQSQADFLAPEGYQAVYETNAITKHGEHGNALLTPWPVLCTLHEDMSDHRFEQRGLLYSALNYAGHTVHVIVVHLGLVAGSRVRQVQQLARFIDRQIPGHEPLLVAGDFNDWGAKLLPLMATFGLSSGLGMATCRTYPSRLPMAQLDHIYARGLRRTRQYVPQAGTLMGRTGLNSWARLSDHLPLIAEFELP
ncbi:endonuclease/exonuclease/phosphatase family protein [Brachymonas sp.]|uniref:endonuclease/exonuclease/phosphatase family protein n=1 Tax=Brachymonas sp. TaxID=1936292 RepID=UPI0035AEAC25